MRKNTSSMTTGNDIKPPAVGYIPSTLNPTVASPTQFIPFTPVQTYTIEEATKSRGTHTDSTESVSPSRTTTSVPAPVVEEAIKSQGQRTDSTGTASPSRTTSRSISIPIDTANEIPATEKKLGARYVSMWSKPRTVSPVKPPAVEQMQQIPGELTLEESIDDDLNLIFRFEV